MSQLWTIARREFRGYFDQPTAYILVVAFLALGLFLTFRSLFASGIASLRPFFDLLPWLFAVFVPAITMRSLAEERRSGTLEWLMAQPIDELQLAAGKFLGNWLFALVALAGTLPMAFGVALFSAADPGILFAQYIGAALLAAQMVAIGLFASSATKNQITAFIFGAAICLTLVLAGLPFTLFGLPPTVAALVGQLSVVQHFDGITRGVVDLRDALYFASTAALFLALACFLLTRGRLSARRAAYGRLRLGTAAIGATVVVLNLLGGHIHGRVDLTSENLYTLADGTKRVVGDLDDIVTVKLFASRELPPEVQLTLRDVRDLLADYRRASDGRVRVVEYQPDRDDDAADEARALGIREINFNVLRDDEIQLRRGWFGLAIQYAGEDEVIPVISRTDDLEYRLTSSIASLTEESRPRLGFLTAGGARGPAASPSFREQLADRYEIVSVDAPQEGGAPAALSTDSLDVLVVAGPTQPLDPAVIEAVDRYLDRGGAAFVLAERHTIQPGMPVSQGVTTGLEPLLEARGVRVAPEMAYDLRSNERVSLGSSGIFSYISQYPLWPVALAAADHATTRGLEALTLGWASPLEITAPARVLPLWSTTEYGGRQPAGMPIAPDREWQADPESLGSEVLAALIDDSLEPRDRSADAAGGSADAVPAAERADTAAEEDGASGNAAAGTGDVPGGRLVVVGDADVLDEQFARGNPQNLVFAANAIDWLAQDDALIAIRSKDRTPPPLRLESEAEQAALKWGNLIGVPLLFVGFGAVRLARRRSRRDLPWEEVQG